MAERLAPLTVEAPITSRPEQTRRRRWRWGRRVLGALVVGALLLAGTVSTAHFLSIERHAHEIRATSLVPLGTPARVLVVVARPGQELPMAGTLAALHEAGTSVSLLSMVGDVDPAPAGVRPDRSGSGEAVAGQLGPGGDNASQQSPGASPSGSGGTAAPADIAAPAALEHEAATLGLDSVAVAGFVPGGLLLSDPAPVIGRIRAAVRSEEPSAIITVSDTSGSDQDSQAVAGYAMLAAAEPGSGVARVWTVSRGAWERDWQALAGDDVDQKVPTPQVAVRLLGDIAGIKSAAMADYARNGLVQAVDARYPGWDDLPRTLYLRFWDREYFALAWGTPVE